MSPINNAMYEPGGGGERFTEPFCFYFWWRVADAVPGRSGSGHAARCYTSRPRLLICRPQ